MRRVLRQRDFLLVWTGGLVSVAGDYALFVVLPYVVYVTTGSTVATAAMVVTELVPGMVLASLAGVFVDRWDLRRLLVATNLGQAGVVSLLLLAPDLETLALVYVVAAAQSSLAAFSQPAESALLPALVAPDDLVAANALNAVNNRIGRLAGLPLGSALAQVATGGAQVSIFAYPRSDNPETESEVEEARDKLIRSLGERAPGFLIIRTRIGEVDGAAVCGDSRARCHRGQAGGDAQRPCL